jgi:hypothetical protein
LIKCKGYFRFALNKNIKISKLPDLIQYYTVVGRGHIENIRIMDNDQLSLYFCSYLVCTVLIMIFCICCCFYTYTVQEQRAVMLDHTNLTVVYTNNAEETSIGLNCEEENEWKVEEHKKNKYKSANIVLNTN